MILNICQYIKTMIATAQNKHLDVDAMLSTCDTCLSNKQHTEHVITLYNLVYIVCNPQHKLICCQGIYMGVLSIKIHYKGGNSL